MSELQIKSELVYELYAREVAKLIHRAIIAEAVSITSMESDGD